MPDRDGPGGAGVVLGLIRGAVVSVTFLVRTPISAWIKQVASTRYGLAIAVK